MVSLLQLKDEAFQESNRAVFRKIFESELKRQS